MEPTVRIVIIDDHEMVREGLRMLLRTFEDLDVVGIGESGEDAVALTAALAPDVVLLDVRLPVDAEGIAAARKLLETAPKTRVVMVSALPKADHLVAALMAGAAGFLSKSIGRDALADAIRHVAAGGTVYDVNLTDEVFAALRAEAAAAVDPRLASLSERELEILRLVADGCSNIEIGRQLHLAVKTVKNHLTHLLGKLNVRTRSEAAAYYVKRAANLR